MLMYLGKHRSDKEAGMKGRPGRLKEARPQVKGASDTAALILLAEAADGGGEVVAAVVPGGVLLGAAATAPAQA